MQFLNTIEESRSPTMAKNVKNMFYIIDILNEHAFFPINGTFCFSYWKAKTVEREGGANDRIQINTFTTFRIKSK